ncbi:outer membrane protein assembly factor BamB [Catenuloplanes nepalensis]|uniref:Outer membrane protein assembly factor BamB n=1 Tax=Catenuloplanes nepalensis TaxID=587533 RepID=A0ABT9MK90_9ACTN|nr:PQQ-binding-like beta-propeller repeat protein [Catenuloplanes nepalensis]MDP9791847.1 outer membrane protein assembly factor BamB [Catenuloplanes nepalensis]
MKRTLLAAALMATFVPGPALAASVDPVLEPPVADTNGPTLSQVAMLTRAWSTKAGELSGDPLYFAGAIYHAETGDGRVGLVRRAVTGGAHLQFASTVRGYTIAAPVTDGDSVLTITPDDGVVRAYSPDGADRWTARLGGDQRADWVLATGGLILAAAEFECGRYEGDTCERTVLHAFRADSGRRVWTRELAGGSPVAVAAGDRIAIRTWQDRDELHGDDIIPPGQEPEPIVDDSPALVTVLTAGNRRLWQRPVAGVVSIAADADGVFVAGDRLCAYRAKDGRRSWCAPTSHRHYDLTAADGRLYAAADDLSVPDDHRIAAFDNRTGRRLWTAAGARPYGGITVGNGVVWLVSNTDMPVSRLLALRAEDGRELRRLPLGEYGGSRVALGVNRAFVFHDGRTISAYR